MLLLPMFLRPGRFLFFLLVIAPLSAGENVPNVAVGVARIDITPELPIRLAGYAARPADAEKIQTRLYARALAIGSDEQKPAVLVTVETVGIPAALSEAVAATLKKNHGIERSRVAICATHIHTGPAITGVLSDMFSGGLRPEDEQRIEGATRSLGRKIEEVAAAALAGRKPARLAWGEGRASFARQRRKIVDGQWVAWGAEPEGSADHSLPVLRVSAPDGKIRALFLSYACHCTTLVAEHNFVHSDWAGDAAGKIEAKHVGSVALVAIGCGADANPFPREALEHVSMHGTAIAAEVNRLLGTKLSPLGVVTETQFQQIELPFDHRVTREELAQRAGTGRIAAKYNAAKWLRHVEAGKPIPAAMPFPIQTWSFSDDLAMVFLGGEVVSEYALRLKRELDATRLWVNAYANSMPGYLPSRTMFDEGGYEVTNSMDYYGWPTRLSFQVEDQVVSAVRALVPPAFNRKAAK